MRVRLLVFMMLLLTLMPGTEPAPDPVPAPSPGPAVQIIPPVQTVEKAEAPEPSEPGPPEDLHVIENCTVTWYTADTCGKTPDHPAYGITASGLPVEEHVTCAVDPEVIPMFSEVYVRYADGSVGRFLATDTGVKGDWVDIYTSNYDYAVRCGMQSLTVYWTAPEGGGLNDL